MQIHHAEPRTISVPSGSARARDGLAVPGVRLVVGGSVVLATGLVVVVALALVGGSAPAVVTAMVVALAGAVATRRGAREMADAWPGPMVDELTGLAGRRVLDDRLELALAAQRRSGDVVLVLFVDLDGFKRVNDAHGHRVGDQVLVAAAHGLSTALRPTDTVARVGGDEFVVVLASEEGRVDVDRLRDRLRSAVEAATSGIGVPVTASIGVASRLPGPLPSPGEGRELVAAADTDMYEGRRVERCRTGG